MNDDGCGGNSDYGNGGSGIYNRIIILSNGRGV
jgi:hypothetical protein